MNNDHPSTTTTVLGSRGWSLYTGKFDGRCIIFKSGGIWKITCLFTSPICMVIVIFMIDLYCIAFAKKVVITIIIIMISSKTYPFHWTCTGGRQRSFQQRGWRWLEEGEVRMTCTFCYDDQAVFEKKLSAQHSFYFLFLDTTKGLFCRQIILNYFCYDVQVIFK